MKKTYKKAELKEKAEEVFKNYPSAKKAFATTDGNVFLMKNRADIHAGKDGQVFDFENENVKAETPAETVAKGNKDVSVPAANQNDDAAKAAKTAKMQQAKTNAKALVNTIKTLKTVEAVNKAIEGKPAKSVLKAAAAQIILIEAAVAGNESTSEEEE